MFHVFPQAVSKKECEKLLEYCIKNTKFQEASMMKEGDSDASANMVVLILGFVKQILHL